MKNVLLFLLEVVVIKMRMLESHEDVGMEDYDKEDSNLVENIVDIFNQTVTDLVDVMNIFTTGKKV